MFVLLEGYVNPFIYSNYCPVAQNMNTDNTFKNVTVIGIPVLVFVYSGNKQSVSRTGNESSRRRGKP
jgi:hypothetical protein